MHTHFFNSACAFLKVVIFIPLFLSSIFIDNLRSQENNFYDQGNSNRMAAEWEPALGTIIAWPLTIPYKLVVELANDNKLYTLVEDEKSKNDAVSWFSKWGIDVSKVSFIYAPQGIDVSWVRDWGPHAVFTPEGKMMLADGKYIFATPLSSFSCTDSLDFMYMDGDKIIKTDIDDNATVPIGKQINIEVLDLPFISTGGNVMTDGLGTGFSSCILTNENRYYGVTDDQFFLLNTTLLGLKNYNILSNFEDFGIQHIDCLMKVLDEDRIMVVQPPSDHALYPVYENIVKNELSLLRNYYGRPYKIVRMQTGVYNNNHLAAYSNSLILNKTIYVPLFQIKEDSAALRRWRELMPGYTVKGFEFDLKNEPALTQQMKQRYVDYGWTHGDALHCRTRAVWDQEMLFITVKKLEEEVSCAGNKKVYASIIDYCKKGLINEKILLNWRIKGTKEWIKIKMNNSGENYFEAEMPCDKAGVVVEYFISAEAKSGKREKSPRTAPDGFYTCYMN
ncbi:MAG: agmatine deiminase family protein [Saprospiraceae bacterium]|nr:agmatine deiminase family protein [Saprospiraceae bacterium]